MFPPLLDLFGEFDSADLNSRKLLKSKKSIFIKFPTEKNLKIVAKKSYLVIMLWQWHCTKVILGLIRKRAGLVIRHVGRKSVYGRSTLDSRSSSSLRILTKCARTWQFTGMLEIRSSSIRQRGLRPSG